MPVILNNNNLYSRGIDVYAYRSNIKSIFPVLKNNTTRKNNPDKNRGN